MILYFKTFKKKIIPKQTLDEIEPDLQRFGQSVLDDIAAMGDDVENPNHYLNSCNTMLGVSQFFFLISKKTMSLIK